MKVLLFKKYNQQDFAGNLLPEDFTAEGIKDFVKSGKFANALYNETKQINLRDIWRIISNTIWI